MRTARAVLLLAIAIGLGLSAAVVVAPPAEACIAVYPTSALCGNPVAGAKRVVCWETDGLVCVP